MALIRSRDALVRSRAMLVNHVRGMMKSCGERFKSGVSTQSFHKHAGDIPERIQPALEPVMKSIEEISRQIKAHDRRIVQVSRKRYPETALLQEISGVGPITALAFILVVSDIERFKKNRPIA
jgi:transposase